MLFVYSRGCRERCYLFTAGGVGRGVICLQQGMEGEVLFVYSRGCRERCYLFTAGGVGRGVICLQQGV